MRCARSLLKSTIHTIALARLALGIGLLALTPVSAQVPATIADQLSTDEHLAKPGWWPRKGDASRTDYVGAEVCAQCHSALANGQKQHAMAHTFMPVAQADALTRKTEFKLGPFNYQITPQNGTATYTVTGNGESFSTPILWAFGSGNRGQSFLFRHNGNFYEARISFFHNLGFDITPDRPRTVPDSLESALGREISAEEAPTCFGCHSTASGTNNRFDAGHSILGI